MLYIMCDVSIRQQYCVASKDFWISFGLERLLFIHILYNSSAGVLFICVIPFRYLEL